MEPHSTETIASMKRSSQLLTQGNSGDSSRSSKINSPTTRNLWLIIGAKIPARLVLYFLSWSGFLVSFMMRNDINFALVAMVKSDESLSSYCHQVVNGSGMLNVTNQTITFIPPSPPPSPSPLIMIGSGTEMEDNFSGHIMTMMNNSTRVPYENQSEIISQVTSTTTTTIIPIYNKNTQNHSDMYQYTWSSGTKSIIVSSFYWCYVLSQVVGGIATQYFGTKHVFGWSQFATALCSLCLPQAADLHYSAVIALRSIQGFASGLTWPAMYAIVGYWIPLSERSRFMSSFQGFSIGIGLTYPLCGFIIDRFGWRYVFYTTGTLGMAWCLMWYFLAFNTPKEHPRITPKELEYIEVNTNNELKESQGMRVPWRQIFTSLPVWAIAITTFGRIWIHYIFIIGGPTFMKHILGFDYKSNGLLSGMPFLCSYISSVLFCYAADQLVSHRIMSLRNVRKIFTSLSQIVPGILVIFIGYIDKDIVVLLLLWFIAVTFITASYAGAMANIVDIAPNLAGPVLAFCQTIHMSASFLSPLVAGFIVKNEDSIEQWRIVFCVSAFVCISTYAMFQIFAVAEIQKWNYPQPRIDCVSEESQNLQKSESTIRFGE